MMSVWQRYGKRERETPKHLKKETQISVIIEQAPKLTTQEGKFGKRQMYIIGTKEYGDIFVSQATFCRIAQGIGDLTSGLYITET